MRYEVDAVMNGCSSAMSEKQSFEKCRALTVNKDKLLYLLALPFQEMRECMEHISELS